MFNSSEIHVILLTHSRIEYLHNQLRSLEEQTINNKIILHIINNNYKTKSEILEIVKKNYKIKINFEQRDNSRLCFERFYYVRENLLNNSDIKYVMFIDDDQVFSPDQIKSLCELSEEKTFTTWYGRKFSTDTSPSEWYKINTRYCLDNTLEDIKYFNYGGPGFSIIDISIFNQETLLWVFETWQDIDLKLIYSMDDIMLSWAISQMPNWKIKRSFLPPLQTIIDKKSISGPLMKSGKKSNFLQFLNNKKSFFTNLA